MIFGLKSLSRYFGGFLFTLNLVTCHSPLHLWKGYVIWTLVLPYTPFNKNIQGALECTGYTRE